jgi:hypothetical protein
MGRIAAAAPADYYDWLLNRATVAVRPEPRRRNSMDKTVIGLVAAMGAAAPLAGAQAAVMPSHDAAAALSVASVAELLDPVPNAAAILAALDADNKPAEAAGHDAKGQQLAWHHHHHWHHHHWWHHHHHWHHHHWW